MHSKGMSTCERQGKGSARLTWACARQGAFCWGEMEVPEFKVERWG